MGVYRVLGSLAHLGDDLLGGDPLAAASQYQAHHHDQA